MSSKVIKEDRSEGVFKMREFATVERGEKDYNLRSFADDEELSVQDMFSDTGEEEPETIEEYEDEVTDKDYWPPSRLAKAEDGIVGEKVDLPAGKLGQGFVEAPMFSDSVDDEPKSPTVIRSRNNDRVEDDLPAEDIPVMHTASDNHAPQAEHNEGSIISNEEFIPNPEMSPLISESELEALKNELASYKEQIDGYKAHAEEMEALKLTVEKALMERDKQLDTANTELETLKSTLPEQLAASKEEGRQEGYEQAKVEFEKHYEVEKADYMAKLDAFYKDALAKLEEVKSSINAIDDQIPATVIGFVKTLIGEERKINDSYYVLFKQGGKVKYIIPIYETESVQPLTTYPQPPKKQKHWWDYPLYPFRWTLGIAMGKDDPPPRTPQSLVKAYDLDSRYYGIDLYYNDRVYKTIFKKE